MTTGSTVEEVPWTHTLEAARDEARLIQDSLLPGGTLRGESFEVAFRFAPLGEVGGDFADFFQLPNGLVGMYMGDVVGKGLIAAMYASLVMGTIRGINKTGEDTAAVLGLLNKRLRVRPVPGRFSSTIYALFDPALGELASLTQACRSRCLHAPKVAARWEKADFLRACFRTLPTKFIACDWNQETRCCLPRMACTKCATQQRGAELEQAGGDLEAVPQQVR